MSRLPGLTTRRQALAAVVAFLGFGVGALGAASAQGREPYVRFARVLPLELQVPPVARAGQPRLGISVRLQNPGEDAPDARVRIIIHEKGRGSGHHHGELNPDNVKVEVLERGGWSPVLLGIVDGGVIGAIGEEGLAVHRERHRRGGMAIRAGFDRRWPLRVTFMQPGTYTVLVAVSPDNGSRHLAQPAFADIEVR